MNIFRKIQYGIRFESSWWGTSAVNRCQFEEILKDGIFMAEGSLRTERCQFLNNGLQGINILKTKGLYVQDCEFTCTDEVAAQSFGGNNYRHIFATGFALSSIVEIKHNFFEGEFLNSEKHEYIHCIELLGAPNMGAGTSIKVHFNEFRLVEANYLTAVSGFGAGIYLKGEFPSSSTTSIEINKFFLDHPTSDANVSGLTGIVLNSGNKNNIKIYGNTFNSDSWSPDAPPANDFGISLHGSIGTGSELTGNIFENDPNTFYSNNFSTGITATDFLNVTFCENDVRECNGPIAFSGTSMGNKLFANILTGGGNMLEIRDGYIGDQGIEGGMHNGNKWYDKSFIVVPVEHAYCSPPEQAPNSVFRANTPQSVRNPFGLAGYIYFSEFHPADINPDQTDEWFKEDPSGYPGMGCVDHIVVATETDRAIADGTIITTGLSPAHSWTGKRYLYDKLKQNPSLQDEYSEFSTFLNNESQTAVGQLYAVEQKITEALKIPVEMEIQLGQLKTQENAVLTDILLADSLLNTSSILEEMTTVTHDKEEALKALQNIDSLYNELNIGYQANLTTKFQEALALNELVTSAAPYEKYEKIVNDIVLRQLLFQSGELTDEQVTILNTIASECPKYNGHGVYRARGLLTGCNERNWDDSNNECSPLENLVQEQVIGNGIGERTTAKLAGTENIFIYPNPATDGVYIQTKPDYSGQLLIQDMTGKKWKEVLFKSKEITQYIDLANVPNGVYFCTVSYSNGERQVFKFFVVKP